MLFFGVGMPSGHGDTCQTGLLIFLWDVFFEVVEPALDARGGQNWKEYPEAIKKGLVFLKGCKCVLAFFFFSELF